MITPEEGNLIRGGSFNASMMTNDHSTSDCEMLRESHSLFKYHDCKRCQKNGTTQRRVTAVLEAKIDRWCSFSIYVPSEPNGHTATLLTAAGKNEARHGQPNASNAFPAHVQANIELAFFGVRLREKSKASRTFLCFYPINKYI